ncbi:MAG: asparagine synthase, partial [Proteobacteria bacterium]|nr:asparagine synthase [Pseudomonadota bacterium]
PKGLLAVPGFPRRLRLPSLVQYLTFSYVPGRHTMLCDVEELLAGHALIVRGDEPPRLLNHFRFEEDEESEVSDVDWPARFRDVHARAVRDRLPAGEPLAAFLSGGIDSSIVVAELAAQGVGPLHTFTIHFGDQYPNELDFAREVAERCNTVHHEVLVEPRDFLDRLRQAIWYLDDAIGDPITIPNFELARCASKVSRFVYNGEGGDPCFGGPKNLGMMLHHWYGMDREPHFRERAYLASYRRAYTELEYLLTPEVRASAGPEHLEGLLSPFLTKQKPRLFLHKLMAINIRFKGAHLILPKVERMLGAWGVTPLSPLFDERIVRLSFAMPGTMKVCRGVEKVVLKKAYRDDLPARIIDRPKSGMRVPVHWWFRDELKDYARDILDETTLRRGGLFDPARVSQL